MNTRDFIQDSAKTTRYVLQSYQDSIAFLEDTPIRILDESALGELYPQIRTVIQTLEMSDPNIDSSAYLQAFGHDQAEFDALLEKSVQKMIDLGERARVTTKGPPGTPEEQDKMLASILQHFSIDGTLFEPQRLAMLADIMPHVEERIWLTLPSNPIPVQNVYRVSAPWRWLVLFWKYDRLIRQAPGQTDRSPASVAQEESRYFVPSMRWNSKPFTFAGRRLRLVAGPVFRNTNALLTRQYSSAISRAILFYRAFLRAADPKLPVSTWSRLQALGHTRTPQSRKQLERSTNRAIDVIRALENFTLPQDARLERHTHELAASWVHFLHSRNRSGSAQVLLKDASDPNEQVWVLFSDNPTSYGLRLEARHDEATGADATEELGEEDTADHELAIASNGARGLSQLPFRQHLSVAQNAEQLQNSQRQQLLHDWLYGNFGQQGREQSVFADSRNQFVARWIAYFVRGDTCSLYSYRHYAEALQPEVTFTRDLSDRAYHELLANHMPAAWNHGRTSLPAYRAIDEARSVFLESAVQDDIQILLPEGQTTTALPAKSVIATPILFNSRPLGVLEVRGHHGGQFRWRHQHALDQIASVIAPVLHTEKLLEGIEGIDTLILESLLGTRGGDDKAQSTICSILCDILLCYGATIWERDRVDDLQFRLTGTKHGPAGALAYHVNQPDYLAAKILADYHKGRRTRPDWIHARVRSLGKWHFYEGADFERHDIPRELSDYFVEKQIQCMTVLYVWDPRDEGERETPLASIALYSKSHVGHEKNWDGILRQIQKSIAIALRSLGTLTHREMALRSIIEHEVDLDAKFLSTRALRLEALGRRAVGQVQLHKSGTGTPSRSEIDLLLATFPKVVSELRFFRGELIRKIGYLRSDADYDSLDIRFGGDLFQHYRDSMRESEPVAVDIVRSFSEAFSADPTFHDRGLVFQHQKHIAHWEDRAAQRASIQLDTYYRNWLTVVTNLVTNAAKYAHGNPIVECRLVVQPSYAYIEVRNSGRRIPPRKAHRLFQRNYRAHEATDIPGRGEGLHIVQNVAQMLGLSVGHEQVGQPKASSVQHIFRISVPVGLIRVEDVK